MFTTRVIRQIEAAHHNGPPDSKCYVNHGHSWRIVVELWVKEERVDKSPWAWGVDFHLVKEIIDYFDHKDLNDIFGTVPASAETLAMAIYHELELKLVEDAGPNFVEVHEGSGNSVRYSKK